MAASQGNYEVVKMLLSSTQHPDVNARANVSVSMFTKTNVSVYYREKIMFRLSVVGVMSVTFSNFLPENGAANTIIMIDFFVHICVMEFYNGQYVTVRIYHVAYSIDSAMISVHALHVSICRTSPLCL